MPSASVKAKGASGARLVYGVLKKEILSGSIAGDTPLRQDDLAKRFGLSKIPVREALRLLEADGIVAFRPRRGAIVVKLTPEDLNEIHDIRLALECRALELAIPNMVNADLLLAREILDQYSTEQDMERWSDLNVRFHLALYEPCGRPRLLSMIRDLQAKTGLFTRLWVTMATGLKRPHTEHIEILEHCINKDIPAAVAHLRHHIQTTQKEATAYFRRKAIRTSGEDGL